MNYNVYRLTENDHGYYFYFLSSFSESNMDCVAESIEHYISNEHTDMNKYLMSIDFDNVKIEYAMNTTVMSIVNGIFQPDDKNMLISDSYKAFIPQPKEKKKREAKPKPEKEAKQAKPRAKKSNQVNISTEPTVVQMN